MVLKQNNIYFEVFNKYFNSIAVNFAYNFTYIFGFVVYKLTLLTVRLGCLWFVKNRAAGNDLSTHAF